MTFGYFPPKDNFSLLRHPILECKGWLLGQDNLLKRAHVRETFRLLDLRPEDEILELGAGNMYYAGEIAKKVKRMTALEYRKGFHLWMQGRKIADSLLPIRADAQALPFKDESFDKVFISELFSVLKDLKACTEESFRVLRHGGKIITVHGNWFYRMERLFDWYPTRSLIKKAHKKWNTPLTYEELKRMYHDIHNTNPEFFEDRDSYVVELLKSSGFQNINNTWAIKPLSETFYSFLLLLAMWKNGKLYLGTKQVMFLPIMNLIEKFQENETRGLTVFCCGTKDDKRQGA